MADLLTYNSTLNGEFFFHLLTPIIKYSNQRLGRLVGWPIKDEWGGERR